MWFTERIDQEHTGEWSRKGCDLLQAQWYR